MPKGNGAGQACVSSQPPVDRITDVQVLDRYFAR
jgi:hypothetical protein